PDTVTLTMVEGTTAETLGAATFTVTGAGAAAFNATAGAACTPYTGAAYTGGVTANTTLWTAIRSIRCTNTAGTMEVKITNGAAFFTVDTGIDASDGTATITVTKGTNYAVGSMAAANNSDLGLAVTGGVLPAASFVWSDLSASSHGLTTTDWTNGLFVRNLPTDTQNLVK
ncbi:MAG: hypothetical protein AAB611_00020, partial [Patescibacteria group bacterium]